MKLRQILKEEAKIKRAINRLEDLFIRSRVLETEREMLMDRMKRENSAHPTIPGWEANNKLYELFKILNPVFEKYAGRAAIAENPE